MSHTPEIRMEAYQIYLAGNSPEAIARELARRHPGEKMPSSKTVEQWAYSPVDGKTWSERRYAAEAAAQDVVTKDFVSAKTKMLGGMIKLQAALEKRALESAEDANPGSFSQEVFAYINATKATANLLESKLAEETRKQDAIDLLIEAVRRTVPDFEAMEPKVRAEFQRLVGQGPAAASGEEMRG